MNIQIVLYRGKYRFCLIDTKGEPSVIPHSEGAWRQSTYRSIMGKRPRLAIDEVYGH